MYLTDKQIKNWGKKLNRKAAKVRHQYQEDKKDYARVLKKLGPRPNPAFWAMIWDLFFQRPHRLT